MSYDELIKKVKRISTLGNIGGLLGWDQETMMPPNGLKVRSEEMALISELSHEWFTDDKIGELIEAAKEEQLDEDQQANVREIEWEYRRSKALPTEFVVEYSKVTTEAMEVWRKAREDNDYASFAPFLQKIVDLNKKYAAYIDDSKDAYEVLLESYDNGLTLQQISTFFDELKTAIVPLIEQTNDQTDISLKEKKVPVEKQRNAARALAEYVGYNFKKGRIDESTHPFTGYESRITTRYEDDWVMTLMSTIHELGHGMYEQGLSEEARGTPLGEAASLSVHEGMSRFWENNIGRSKAFWTGYFPKVNEAFELNSDLDTFYGVLNKVEPGFIRVDADELTYTMHIILRFEIEKELLDGSLSIEDLPRVWNERMQKYLGITPENDTKGCLQDTHWAMGSFGYFPSYALGNIVAAQLLEGAKKDIPGLMEQVAKGNFDKLHDWLQKNVYDYGQKYHTGELVERATGKKLSTEDYIAYMREKFQ